MKLYKVSSSHHYKLRHRSALPAEDTKPLAARDRRLLTVCFVACKYGERAPARADTDIIFAHNKGPPHPSCGHDATLRGEIWRAPPWSASPETPSALPTFRIAYRLTEVPLKFISHISSKYMFSTCINWEHNYLLGIKCGYVATVWTNLVEIIQSFKITAFSGQAFYYASCTRGPRDVNMGPLTKYGEQLHNGNLREYNLIKMKIPKRKLFLLIIFAYVAFSLYAAYNVFFSTKVISRVHRVVKKETGALSGNFT